MAKFRKNPIVIDAIQWNGQPPFPIADALGVPRRLLHLPAWYREDMPLPKLQVNTLEGTMEADHGDWIIKGVAGELYPCKDDIFRETYTAVD